jgi:hypothetical protein
MPKWQCFRDGTLLVSPNGRKIIKPVVDYLRNNMSPISKLESQGWERLGGILSAYVCIVTRSCGIEEMEHVQRKVDLFFESMHPESKNCSKLSLKEYSPFQYMTKRADLYDFCMRDHASALREQARVATELEYEVASVRANYGNCAQGTVLKNHGHVPTAPKQTSVQLPVPPVAPLRRRERAQQAPLPEPLPRWLWRSVPQPAMPRTRRQPAPPASEAETAAAAAALRAAEAAARPPPLLLRAGASRETAPRSRRALWKLSRRGAAART